MGNHKRINLDKYFTKPKLSKELLDKVINFVEPYININEYTFLEPSVGNGSFFNLLPKNRRVGIDIEPQNNDEIILSDYLEYKFDSSKKYIVIGNPPFGVRGGMALKFINHSYENVDFVCFILPQLFISDGKSVPRHRVNKGYRLVYNEYLPGNSFINSITKKEMSIHTVFQIWTKIDIPSNIIEEKRTINSIGKVISLSNGPTSGSQRNVKLLDKCDVYLPSTTFKELKSYINFNSLPHQRGYGIIINSEYKKELKEKLLNFNWQSVVFKSTNSANNLRTSLIKKVIIDLGYYDKENNEK